MPAPYDYGIEAKDPLQAIMQSLSVAGGISSGLEAQREAERKRLAQAEMQRDFSSLAAKPSSEEIIKFSLKYPGMSENLKRSLDMLNEEKKTNSVAQASQIYSALSAGKPEIATQLLEENIAAHKNSGNAGEQRSAELMLKLVQASPGTAQTQAGLMLASAMGADKFSETFTKISEEGRKAALFDPEQAKAKEAAELKKMASDADLSGAQAAKAILEGRKISAETAKLLIEVEQLKKTGGMDPTKKFELEDKVRKEYNSRIGKFTELRGTYDVITSSAQDKSGAGDIALVTSFMKMLDPTSVVRETEFANARDTSGLLERLKNQAQKLQSGAFLDDSQRQSFLRLAGQYLKASEEHEKRTRSSLEKTVKSYGLDSENVFGSEASPVSPIPSASGSPASSAASSSGVAEKTQSLLQKYGPKQ